MGGEQGQEKGVMISRQLKDILDDERTYSSEAALAAWSDMINIFALSPKVFILQPESPFAVRDRAGCDPTQKRKRREQLQSVFFVSRRVSFFFFFLINKVFFMRRIGVANFAPCLLFQPQWKESPPRWSSNWGGKRSGQASILIKKGLWPIARISAVHSIPLIICLLSSFYCLWSPLEKERTLVDADLNSRFVSHQARPAPDQHILSGMMGDNQVRKKRGWKLYENSILTLPARGLTGLVDLAFNLIQKNCKKYNSSRAIRNMAKRYTWL